MTESDIDNEKNMCMLFWSFLDKEQNAQRNEYSEEEQLAIFEKFYTETYG